MLMASHLGAALALLRGLGQEGAFTSDFLHGLENPTWSPKKALSLSSLNETSSSSSQC